jgi:hypothetical protein
MSKRIKNAIQEVPILGDVLRALRRGKASPAFTHSSDYWDERYRRGGNSGAGSYNRLALFKSEYLNQFVRANDIRSVIEHGSGDGAQLKLADYPDYVGVDVSERAIALCREIFSGDTSRRFLTTAELPVGITADLTLSLDVIYHLVEDDVFDGYMRLLFDTATRFVIIYSSNFERAWSALHVRHRKFTVWVERNKPEWRLASQLPNRFPYDPRDPDHTSFADFYQFAREERG